MTTNRARAYGRVIDILDELGPAKLHADEQQVVRDAADALLFTADVASDTQAKAALNAAVALVERLVDNERLLPETGEGILDAIESCGPQTEPLQLPAVA